MRLEAFIGRLRGHDILPNLPTWDERIRRAMTRKRFTKGEVRMAEDWTHCQVGELKQYGYRIPSLQHRNYEPVDPDLHELGMKFWWAISTNQPQLARDLSEQIRALAPLPVLPAAKRPSDG